MSSFPCFALDRRLQGPLQVWFTDTTLEQSHFENSAQLLNKLKCIKEIGPVDVRQYFPPTPEEESEDLPVLFIFIFYKKASLVSLAASVLQVNPS